MNIQFRLNFVCIEHASGWAVVQMRVLHELIFSARKMGDPALAVR